MSTPANQSGTQRGQVTPAGGGRGKPAAPKPAAPKKLSRVDRFQTRWSASHQARVLNDIGMTPADFAKLSPGEKAAAVNRGLAAGRTLDNPGGLTRVPTIREAQQEAVREAQLAYAPQQQALNQLSANVGPWFQDFMNRVQGTQHAAGTAAAPVLSQAQAYQQGAAAQGTPGLDPNSAAGMQAAQAAQGRQALSQLGLDALNTNALATQNYFGGLQTTAARQLPQVRQGIANQQVGLDAQKAAKVEQYVTNATLGANVAHDAATTDIAQQNADTAAVRAKSAASQGKANAAAAAAKAKNTASAPNKYGIPADQWAKWSTSHRQRVIAQFGSGSGSGTAAANKAAKHKTDLAKASGKAQNRVQDVINALGATGTKTERVPAPGGLPGSTVTRAVPLTPGDIRQRAIRQYNAEWVGIAERVKAGQPLTPAQVAYLHRSDPNLRIPTSWLRGRVHSPTGSPYAPGATGTGSVH